MPHERKRHLENNLKHLSKLSPLIGVLGHRQVGKTTLLEKISKHYLTFDDEQILNQAQDSPKHFLSRLTELSTALDECQLCEKLFPALEERVRTDKRPGQFYLSGSVRFTSKKLIRESLTGRIMNLELLPMTLSELAEKELPDSLRILMGRKNFLPSEFAHTLTSSEFKKRKKTIDLYLQNGGLPGTCFIRDQKLRAQKVLDQLETILNRDLREVQKTSLVLRDILSFIRELAKQEGEIIHYQDMRRKIRMTPLTQKRLTFALEAVFIIRPIPIEGDYQGHCLFFEDQAEALVLSQNAIREEQQWTGLVYRNLREQAFYRSGENMEFFQFRTRGGSFVPLAIRSPDSILGVIPILGEPTRSERASAQSFLKKYINAKVLFVTRLNHGQFLDDRTALISAAQLLF
jgi:predicted AAA+ superfamily ATPase